MMNNFTMYLYFGAPPMKLQFSLKEIPWVDHGIKGNNETDTYTLALQGSLSDALTSNCR